MRGEHIAGPVHEPVRCDGGLSVIQGGIALDYLWILLCSVLVFIMQAGFLCLESGLTRRKNSINVAVKNLADLCVTMVVFWGVGFGIMFGASHGGWFGTDRMFPDFFVEGGMAGAFFLFQIMVCATSVTIISGAVAERIHLSSYLIIALLVSGLIYPVFGHWAWGGRNAGVTSGWLNSIGFVDFSGSTVVHSIGGWVALAVLLIIGPRRGRFAADGTPRRMKPSNLPMATLGTVLLFIGWLGFNGGSLLALNNQVSTILMNTVVAGSVGAVAAGLLGFGVQNRLNVRQFMNGCLAGLVAITASCVAVSTPIASFIGLIGGMIVIGGEKLLEQLRIDDAVGAIPVHLAAGMWGTLAVGLYGNLELLGTGLTRIEQVGVQLFGIVSCAVWAFAVAYVLLNLVDRAWPLRVPAAHEDLGLNLSEHGETEDYELPDDVLARSERVANNGEPFAAKDGAGNGPRSVPGAET